MKNMHIKRLLYRIRHDYLTLNNIVIAVAFFIALNWAWGSIEAMQRNYQLQQMVDAKAQQVKLEELRVALLEYEAKYYESSEYLDLAVRERLGKGLPGERQIIVASTDSSEHPESSTPSTTRRPPSNFQQWTTFLFGEH